jgi:hypothetical protein
MARKQLSIAGGREIEDWTVPVVFEAAFIQLFPKAENRLEIKLEVRAAAESGLPQAPDVGFIGRDETILKLTGRSMSSTLFCCALMRAAARQALRWSSFAGIGTLVVFPGPCYSPRSSNIRRCRVSGTNLGACSRQRWQRTGFNG